MKTVLITGCSSGIGFATALLLARSGYRVFAGVRRPQDGERLLQAAAGAGLALEPVRIDVTDAESVAACFAALDAGGAAIDVFVNNAGIVALGSVEDVATETAEKVFDTNVLGAFRCFKEVVPRFRQRGSGMIVVVSSQSGELAQAGLGTYCASKWALEALTESVALELAPFNGRVALVQPGGVLIPRENTGDPFPAQTAYQTVYARFMQWNARDYQDAATPEQIAETIAQVIASGAPHLRYPTDFAGRNIAWRKRLSDEEWIGLHALTDDAEWLRAWQEKTGVDIS